MKTSHHKYRDTVQSAVDKMSDNEKLMLIAQLKINYLELAIESEIKNDFVKECVENEIDRLKSEIENLQPK